MAIYRNVNLSFWTDNKVADEFTPEDKYFYLYLLTNPQTNICGCYEVSYSQMVNQTGYNKETITRLIDRFERQHKVIRYDKNTKELLILNWYKYNWNKSERVLAGVENVAKYIKSDELKEYVFGVVKAIRNNTPCILYTYPIQTSVSDSDSDSDSVSDTIPESDSDSNNNLENTKTKYQESITRVIEKYSISEYLEGYIRDWLEYKKERKFRYKEVGLNTLIKTISANAKEYGDEAMATAIQESISSGYQGIVYDIARKRAGQTDVNKDKQSQLDYLLNDTWEEEVP